LLGRTKINFLSRERTAGFNSARYTPWWGAIWLQTQTHLLRITNILTIRIYM